MKKFVCFLLLAILGCGKAEVDRSQLSLTDNLISISETGAVFTGRAVVYHDGDLIKRIGVKDGMVHGDFERYSNGEMVYTSHWNNGIKHGLEITYHPNGRVKTEINYMDGIPVGECNSYYSNGNKKYECGYRDFQRTAEKVENFSQGMKYGLETFYSSDGKKIKTIHWIDGKKHGKEIYYGSAAGGREVVYWRDGHRMDEYPENRFLLAGSLGRVEEHLKKLFT